MEIVNSIKISATEYDSIIRGLYIIKDIANLSKNADMDEIFKKATEIYDATRELEEMIII